MVTTTQVKADDDEDRNALREQAIADGLDPEVEVEKDRQRKLLETEDSDKITGDVGGDIRP